ncbi:MAG TPA: hypothetical protein VN861_02855 [Candidatus Acidoferrales bacterium]|nr:hypothetical protein [Candidatus Acidoferrales bacterium]
MSKNVEAHFVTFLSPGTFMAEDSTKPIDSWDVKKARKMAAKITERYNAVPYAFYFTTRSRGPNDLDSRRTKISPTYYLPHCKVETLAEVKARNDPRESILLSNMECNGYDRIVTTTKGWKWTQPLGKEDVLLRP